MAQDKKLSDKLYAGIQSGVASLSFTENEQALHKRSFTLGFNGGYIVNERVRIGISLSGYLLESYNNSFCDPGQGVSISNNLITLQIFPVNGTPLFVNLGAGMARYTNMHADAYSSSGRAAKFGAGYGWRLKGANVLRLGGYYSWGNMSDVLAPGVSFINRHYGAASIEACFSFH